MLKKSYTFTKTFYDEKNVVVINQKRSCSLHVKFNDDKSDSDSVVQVKRTLPSISEALFFRQSVDNRLLSACVARVLVIDKFGSVNVFICLYIKNVFCLDTEISNR